MPLQNRVDPWGRLHAVEPRGAWMGNRGVLHDASQRIARPGRLKAWILCRLEFKGRRREVFTPGRYSELFFLDEATAFAAGHRPCAECNRERFVAFKRAWLEGNAVREPVKAAAIDRVLHAERIFGAEVTYQARLEELPDGVMIEHGGAAFVLAADAIHRWSFNGYGAPIPKPSGAVPVLTPRSTVGAIAAGFAPQIHPSGCPCRSG